MASTSNASQVLMKRGKRGAAAYIHADCSNSTSPQRLNELLDLLLNPGKAIDEWETIDWCKWLMAGGRTPDEFANIVRTYDNATTCGLVWTPNFVAYRCRTCGISPCMSLCTECFKKGNHQRHDFNMFLSQAGGACDCGDTSVMKETGFCDRHGPNKIVNKNAAPADLMCVAEAMMPRIILRLIQHLREYSKNENSDAYRVAIQDADSFITMLLDFNNMGALMRHVITAALTNPQKYRSLLEINSDDESEYANYMRESKRIYDEAIRSLPNPEPPDEYKDCPSLQEQLIHRTFLEELVFWTVKFEFPQKVVCLLLNMLPDPDYKDALTQAFVLHYSRISMMLERSNDPDTLSNRVVHVSVQLFSNESLALRMAENLNLLHVMVISLKYMMSKILIQNTLHDPDKNFHYVVDCSRQVMKEHCYWPLVSDLNNVLSHRPVAIKFMNDDALLEMWFVFLAMFQGMNVNIRELNQHVEFEPNTYYAAFSAELEASAYPMWALVSHLVDSSTVEYTKRVLNSCLSALQEWLDAVNFTNHTVSDKYQVSFHLPLHRYLAVFMCQAIKMQGVTLRDVLPKADVLHLIMMHPLRVQVAFYEILSGMWVRNGLQIKGQAMTYIQCNFCNSMVDADIYLLQVCSTQLEPQMFIETLIDKFHIKDWLSFGSYQDKGFIDNGVTAPIPSMLECCLTFLATLISVRTNLGLSDTELNRLEMVTLLCMNDKTHSQLMELMPERCGISQHRDFESLLAEVADYKAPNLEASGTMQQGMYVPKSSVWEQQYDPLHVLLRAVHRREFQTSMDRFTEYARQTGKLKNSQTPWPPFREPAPCSEAYEDPRKVLRTRLFHALSFIILYKAVHGHNISEHCIALAVYLLEMCLVTVDKPTNQACDIYPTSLSSRNIQDNDLVNWYQTDDLTCNLRTIISKVTLAPEPEVLPTTYSSDGSEMDWEASEADNELLSDVTESNLNTALMLEESSDIASPNDFIVAITSPNALALNPDLSVVPEQSIATLDEYEDSPTILALPPPPPPPSTSTNTDMTVAIPEDMTVAQISDDHFHTSPAAILSSEMSTSHELAIPTTSNMPRKQYSSAKRRQVEAASNHLQLTINENIISLLLKLHSQLSGAPDSFDIEPTNTSTSATTTSTSYENRIGDGPYFIGNLLNKIANLNQSCKECILETRNRLWPKQQDREEDGKKQREEYEREQRRQRARERQQKLMAEFANKQKQFMEKTAMEEAENNTGNMDWQDNENSRQEYDCVICNQTTPSTENEPMGLVVLLQSSSVTAHRRRYTERVVLPTSEEERQSFHRDDTLANEFDRRIEELDRHFDSQSWLLSVNIGWEGGVHVQTCGHHLHLNCLKSYLISLRSQQRHQNLAVDRGEYLCPLCRQLANSVLPLLPQLGECTAVVRSRPGEMHSILSELTSLLKENHNIPSNSSKLADAIGKSMKNMTYSTELKFKQKVAPPTDQSIFLFVTSIARTNLEIELVQRGGSLVSPTFNNTASDTTETASTATTYVPLMPKRDCIVPLLHVLAFHARVLGQWPTWKVWQQITGVEDSFTSQTAITTIEREVPVLLKDPVALLIQFILLLPLHLDQTYFSCVVKTLYNLLYYQVVAQLSCSMSRRQRQQLVSNVHRAEMLNKLRGGCTCSINKYSQSIHRHSLPSTSSTTVAIDTSASSSSTSITTSMSAGGSGSNIRASSSSSSSNQCTNHCALVNALVTVIESFTTSELYIEDENCTSTSTSKYNNMQNVETQVQKLCLPFLRVASLLKYHLYQQPLPEITSSQSEFVRLVYYLELVTEGMNWNCFNATVALNWASPEISYEIPRLWCKQFAAFVARGQIAARNFLVDQHTIWYPPKLLSLPREYEKIFTYYHERQCSQCHSIPQETSVCLLCGTVVCLKQSCCKTMNVCEAVQHSIDCGGGTGIYLVVTSTYIIVIRGRRACLWGSLYLDEFEEEDRDLKRGKPLYLSQDRYQLLEQQWLAHRFDHTKKTWVWHRDAL